ncbi:GNAT family N-acetyltransferase [Brevibacillus sp. H7]|uniref:GNAT family N-acetyltransferase n=1 Tax=Brevibacillus sp. H7 TaxID=3349138 RepID=UPI00381DCA7D
MLHIQPVTLEGRLVRLEPLSLEHADGLWEAGKYQQIWTYMSIAFDSRDVVDRYLEQALAAREAGTELPFAIIERSTNRVIGSTRFGNISRHDKGLEIGWTWLTPSVWKTAVNTECKWLLLRHCFEELGCIRVQLKTDSRNVNSQRAIERIGGVREGVLRNHMILRDGYVRDSVFFSILDREWPEVNRKLQMWLSGE